MFDLEHNEFSRVLFDQSEDAILVVRLRDVRILEANQVAHQMSATPTPKLLGHALTTFIRPLSEEDFRHMARESSCAGRDFYLHGRDGRVLPVRLRACRVPTAQADACSLIHIREIPGDHPSRSRAGTDVRGRDPGQGLEFELQPLQRRLMDALPEMIWMSDTGKMLSYFNRSWLRFTGRSLEQQLGEGWQEQIHPRDRERRKRIFDDAFAKEQPFTTEYRLRRADGEYRWILDSGTPWTDRGRFVGYLGSCFDITERRRSQQAVQEADVLLQAAFQHSPAGILVAESADVVIRLANPAALEMRGPTDRSLSNIPATQHAAHWQFLHPDGRPCQTEDLPLTRAVLHGETVRSQPLIIRRDDGSRRYVIANAAPIRDSAGDGTITGGIAVLQDTTQQREADKLREELIAELEQKNAELERFTYTVSHDLKSPLITIRGFSKHLAQDALAGKHQQVQDDLAEITQAVDRMERLLSELLELSRIGRRMNPPSEFCLYQLACEAADQVLSAVGPGRPKISVSGELPRVMADRGRISEVLQNLFDNAAKFTATKVEVGLRPGLDANRPVYFVRDDGLGIEPQYLEKIFDLFEQLDPNYEGSGVGLAISRRIVEVHGGQLWAESEGLQQGTTFCFTLQSAEDRK